MILDESRYLHVNYMMRLHDAKTVAWVVLPTRKLPHTYRDFSFWIAAWQGLQEISHPPSTPCWTSIASRAATRITTRSLSVKILWSLKILSRGSLNFPIPVLTPLAVCVYFTDVFYIRLNEILIFIFVISYTDIFEIYRVNSWNSVCPHGISVFLGFLVISVFRGSRPHSSRWLIIS